MPFSAEHPEINLFVRDELEKVGIGYKVDASGQLLVLPRDYRRALVVIAEAGERYLPTGRAVYIHDERTRERFEDELRRREIWYEHRALSGEPWIVWGPARDSEVQEVLENVLR